MASLGSSRFRLVRAQLNPDVAERIAEGLDSGAEAYLRASWRLQRLARRARRGFDGLDAWVGPVKQHLPPAFAGRFESLSAERDLARLCAGPTRVANVFGLCASSQPIQRWGASLPVGLQLLRPAGDESRLLAVALACEQVLGRREPPDMRAYLR
jgi:aspartyl-tRNA(Asn)/glutamyl-tRNA(Gln) amidotransferase subunit A